MVGLKSKIYDLVHSNTARLYWEKKEKAIDLIHWEALQQALEEVPRTRKHFIIKHSMRMCGVGKFMKLWKKQVTDACPCCGSPEDSNHVWICDKMGALDLWNKSLLELGEWMEENQTDPHYMVLLNAIH